MHFEAMHNGVLPEVRPHRAGGEEGNRKAITRLAASALPLRLPWTSDKPLETGRTALSSERHARLPRRYGRHASESCGESWRDRAARRRLTKKSSPIAVTSLYTVARELGQGSEEMVRRVYAHMGTVR
jgi:hypothetical protein